ncbi:MAG: hypothetical protein K0U37_06035 [Gammaproteobacteria bacterium]|nr:hypothetical protein [Gammaproteobacteria bacterium]
MSILSPSTQTDLLTAVKELYEAHLDASALSERNRLNFLYTQISSEHTLVTDFENLLRYQFSLSHTERTSLNLILKRSLTESPSSRNRFSPIFNENNEPISKLDSFMEWFTAELEQYIYSEEEKQWDSVSSEGEEEDMQAVCADDEDYSDYIPGAF